MAYPFQTFTPATDRVGIPDSVAAICDRHLRGYTSTAIVAPPRYGKSDIIRLSALELVATGEASAALALAPWDNLAKQLVATDKMAAMAERYMRTRLTHTPDVYRAGKLSALSSTFHEVSNLQHLFTATIQLVNRNMPQFNAWLERCVTYGKRPIVFIDEGQLLSVKNEWGGIAAAVEQYGAHVVLLTGTPYRADCHDIPGFTVRTISVEDVTRTTRKRYDDTHDLKRVLEGTKEQRILEAHNTVELGDAWAINALCRVEAKWIDVEIKADDESVWLRSMPATESQRHLRSAVTNRLTIEKAMQAAVLDMKERRRAGKSDSAIIVVTTSDIDHEDSDGDANWHARQVRNVVRSIDPNLVTLIATQADDSSEDKQRKGAANLERFVGNDDTAGVGDVLIVKNMGTVGLDCPRIKTVVLLGTTRQLATWVQTILRGATTWGDVKYFTLVLTDDARNRENWDFIVTGQGGEATATDLHLVKEELVEREDIPPGPEPERPEVIGAEQTRTEDSHNDGAVEDDTDVHKAIAKFPILRERMSFVEIKELLKAGAIDLTELETVQSTMGVVNTGANCEALRRDINTLANEITNARVVYNQANLPAWRMTRASVLNAAKDLAGIRRELGKENDEAKLIILRDYLSRMKRAA